MHAHSPSSKQRTVRTAWVCRRRSSPRFAASARRSTLSYTARQPGDARLLEVRTQPTAQSLTPRLVREAEWPRSLWCVRYHPEDEWIGQHRHRSAQETPNSAAHGGGHEGEGRPQDRVERGSTTHDDGRRNRLTKDKTTQRRARPQHRHERRRRPHVRP